MHKLRLVLPMLFVLVILAGQASPAFASTATIAVEPNVADVAVGSTFQVQVWIRNLDAGNPMIGFQFSITWDRTLMRFSGYSIDLVPPDWDTPVVHGGVNGITDDPGGNTGFFVLEEDIGEGGGPISADRLWLTVTFECLGVGSAPLNLPSSVTWSDSGGTSTVYTRVWGEPEDYEVVTVKGAVNQLAPSPPVGGVVMPAGTLAMVAPWLAVIGLVGCIGIMVAGKRRS